MAAEPLHVSRDPAEVASRWLLAVSLAAVAACAACGPRDQKMSYECRCDYVTDTDVPGVQDVRVCAGANEEPKSVASECAQGLGVGQVNGCMCPASKDPCDGPACEQAAAKESR